jgi:uncharacterized Zn-binding protein involved in type VI secretion
MSGSVIRLGDKNVAGGPVLTGEPSVRVNSLPVAKLGSKVGAHSPGKPPHNSTSISRVASTTVRVGGIPVASAGSVDACGHQHVLGSNDVRIGS